MLLSLMRKKKKTNNIKRKEEVVPWTYTCQSEIVREKLQAKLDQDYLDWRKLLTIHFFKDPFWAFPPQLQWRKLKVKVLVIRLCQTLCDPMDCSPPGSSVQPNPGIEHTSPTLQADSLLSKPYLILKYLVLNYGVGEDSCESLGLQRDPTSPS